MSSVGAKRDKALRRTEPRDSIERLVLQDMRSIFDNSVLIKDKISIRHELFRGKINDLLYLNRANLKNLYDIVTGVSSNGDAKKSYKPFTFL